MLDNQFLVFLCLVLLGPGLRRYHLCFAGSGLIYVVLCLSFECLCVHVLEFFHFIALLVVTFRKMAELFPYQTTKALNGTFCFIR